MKKLLGLISVMFLVVGLLSITGCGKKESLDIAGTYEGKYIKFVGDTDENKNESEEFYLELNADGTGIHHRDETQFDLTWAIDGENFTMRETFLGISVDYKGTLKDGKLDIYNGDLNDSFTVEYVYQKK